MASGAKCLLGVADGADEAYLSDDSVVTAGWVDYTTAMSFGMV